MAELCAIVVSFAVPMITIIVAVICRHRSDVGLREIKTRHDKLQKQNQILESKLDAITSTQIGDATNLSKLEELTHELIRK